MNKNKNYDLNQLKNYLIINSSHDKLVLTLEEIEKIIGGKLPSFAYKKSTYNRFWYNNLINNPSYSPYWLDAGFYAHCNMELHLVEFSKEIKVKKHSTTQYRQIRRIPKQPNIQNLDVNTALDLIKKYHNSTNENFTRYKSWEHCYNAFRLYRHNKDSIDLLCLHLSCFLSSWGMLRNSSLLNYDYLVHKDFIKKISDYRYDILYSENYKNEDLIFEIVDLIKNYYPTDISKTDTFITKILLGVFGCVPAYDRYFREGVNYYGICSCSFSRNSLRNLYSYYELNFDHFEKLRHEYIKEGVYYTPMKLLDMCFWQLGFDMENN